MNAALIWSYIQANAGSWARIALAYGAGKVVAAGWLDSAAAGQVVDALGVIVAAMWAAWTNYQRAQGTVATLNAGIAVADATAGRTEPVSHPAEVQKIVDAAAPVPRPSGPPAEPKPTVSVKPKRKHVKKAVKK